MALVTWAGGTRRISDPGAWSPQPPAPGDTALVLEGHVVVLNQVVGPYQLALDGNDNTTTLDAVGATLTGQISGAYIGNDGTVLPNLSPDATIGLLGRNTSSGSIISTGDYIGGAFPRLTIKLADIASPAAIIQQAIFTNSGLISADFNEPISILGPADALFVNNGVFDAEGGEIDAAITGTGTIALSGSLRDLDDDFTLRGAVSVGQTLQINEGTVIVEDPRDFRATVAGFSKYGPVSQLQINARVTSGSFVDHTLTLMNGSAFVTQFKFTSDVAITDFAIDAGTTSTIIRLPYSIFDPGTPIPGNLVPSTTGPVPVPPPVVLPAPAPRLPSTGHDVIDTATAFVAFEQLLNGYTVRLDGPSSPAQASLSISSTTFGAQFTLGVDALHPGLNSGSLYGLGYNQNAGHIGATGAGSTLAVAIGDDISPNGVTILAGVLNNTGTISTGTGASIAITGAADSKLINTGTLASSGMMFIGATVTGTGIVTVGDHAGTAGSLEFGGYVATGQAVNLLAGSLTIDDTKHFFATVFDFGAGDSIRLKGLDVAQATYDNGRLLLDGGADGTLHFIRPAGVVFDTASFKLTHTGTDTIITAVPHV